MDSLLTHQEMLAAVWNMGIKADTEGKEVNQLMRFETIRDTQDTKTRKVIREELGKIAIPSYSRDVPDVVDHYKIQPKEWQAFWED